jgi:hypothetical protein
MADYIELEASADQILLEDDSGLILLESSEAADGEVAVTDELRIDTWEFDSPEPNVGDRDDIDYYLAWQVMDGGAENIDKRIEAIRATCKTSDNGKVQIHKFQQGDDIDKDAIEAGTGAAYEVAIADATAVTRHKRKKGGPKGMALFSVRFSGTWDGTNDRDRLDELVIELTSHGTKK